MFELAYWFCCVGAEPVLTLASRSSRVRHLVRKWNHKAPAGPRDSVRVRKRRSDPSTPATQVTA
jgi:hypothetical protein